MKLAWLTSLFIIALVVLGPGILGIGIRRIPSGFQPGYSNVIDIYGDREVSQNIPAVRNNFSGIGMSIKNPNLLNTKDIFLELHSFRGGISRSAKLSGRNIPDGSLVYFNFDPIPNSKDQQFVFTLRSPETEQSAPLEPFYTTQPVSNTANFFVNHEMGQGIISVVSFYKPQNILEVWGIVYGVWFNKLFQDLPFAIFYSLVIIFCLIYLIAMFAKNKRV